VQRFLDALAFVVVLVALWQLVYWKSEVAITGPLETVETAAALLGSENFWRNALATGRAFGASLILSCVGGVAIGLALGAHRFSGAVAAPMLTALYTIPKVTLYPMVLLIFGLGISAKVAFGALHGIFPVALFTIGALKNTSPVLTKTARVLRLTPVETARTVLLPAALPEIVTGLRIGFSATLLGTLIGELFASDQGIGFMLIRAMEAHKVLDIMALTLLLFAFAALANALLLMVERRFHRR